MGSVQAADETVEGLKRKLQVMEEGNNELKRKFAVLETENVEAKVQKKALTYQLQMVEKENKKLETENESLRVACCSGGTSCGLSGLGGARLGGFSLLRRGLCHIARSQWLMKQVMKVVVEVGG